MNIIGNIIKGVIDVTGKLTPESNPSENQKEVLNKLLNKAKDTTFGKHYGFENIAESDDIQKSFSNKIPYFDYNKISEEWWNKLHEGDTNVTWPDNPDYYALSSGTTGKTSKRIPVTEDMIVSIKSAGIAQIIALSHFDLPATFFDKGILMLGSSTDLIEKKDHLEGEISGISAHNIPSWFRGYYKPGEKF